MNVAPLQVFFNIVLELLSGMTLISFASNELNIKQTRKYAVTKNITALISAEIVGDNL